MPINRTSHPQGREDGIQEIGEEGIQEIGGLSRDRTEIEIGERIEKREREG